MKTLLSFVLFSAFSFVGLSQTITESHFTRECKGYSIDTTYVHFNDKAWRRITTKCLLIEEGDANKHFSEYRILTNDYSLFSAPAESLPPAYILKVWQIKSLTNNAETPVIYPKNFFRQKRALFVIKNEQMVEIESWEENTPIFNLIWPIALLIIIGGVILIVPTPKKKEEPIVFRPKSQRFYQGFH